MDRLTESYRPSIRGNNVVNLSVVAAWRLHCKNLSKKSITSAISVVKITLCLLKAGPQRARKLELAGILPEDVKYDDMDYNLGSISQESCKMCSKTQKYV